MLNFYAFQAIVIFLTGIVPLILVKLKLSLHLTVGCGRVLNSFLFCFFPVSKVGLLLMGNTAGFVMLFSALLHKIYTHFKAEYINKTHILTCILKYLNSNKVPRAKLPTQNVLKRLVLTDSIANINQYISM